ncbi:hypothetical protein K438DRAFT_1961937 [Mycena galopus ATCC 62051]|nr:hypothetical protein K438DRAFT_1961937 [Mycena galopus ATCC 62051]
MGLFKYLEDPFQILFTKLFMRLIHGSASDEEDASMINQLERGSGQSELLIHGEHGAERRQYGYRVPGDELVATGGTDAQLPPPVRAAPTEHSASSALRGTTRPSFGPYGGCAKRRQGGGRRATHATILLQIMEQDDEEPRKAKIQVLDIKKANERMSTGSAWTGT